MVWQKQARLVIAVAGLGLAATVFYQMQGRRPAASPLAATKVEPGADYVGKGGEEVRFSGNKETSVVKYANVTHFPDGRTLMEKPVLLLDRSDRKPVITADTSESLGAPGQNAGATPKETTFKGHVKVTASDGFVLTCAVANYDDETGVLQIPGRADFTRGRLSGHGQRGTYDRDLDSMALFDGAEIDETPDAASQGSLHATSTTLKMTRPAHTLVLADQVVIIRNGETMRSNDAVVALTDDDERVKRMELRGKASVVQPPTASASATTMSAKDIDLDFAPAESTLTATDLRGGASVTQPATAQSRPPQMKAGAIHIDFQPDGRAAKRAVMTENASLDLIGTDNAIRNVRGNSITVVLSLDGQRATALNGHGALVVTLPESAETPARMIHADVLDAKGSDAAGLTSAVFTPAAPGGLVSLVEDQRADAKSQRKKLHREFRAHEMNLKLNGDLGAIEKANFTGSFDFISRSDTETSTGHSEEAAFDEQQGKLTLTGGKAAKMPVVDSDRLRVTATSIDVFTKTSGLKASGNVQSDLKPDASKPASSGLFDATQKIGANADELTYDDDKGDAVYVGRAFVKQGNSIVRGDTVSLSSRTSNVSASGSVQTQLTLDNAPGSAAGPSAGAPMPGTAPCAVAGASCVNAKTMTYDDARRVATYKTGASLIGSGDTAMMADTITLTLAQEGHALAFVTAEGSVAANMSREKQVQGSRLVYTAATDSYVVTGVPLVIVQRSIDKGKESCTTDTYSNGEVRMETENAAMKRSARTTFISKDEHPNDEGHPPSCAAVLKVIK